MWLARQLHPNASALNVVHTFEIYASLDRPVFEASFWELQRQVSVFRFVFKSQHGVPYQEIQDSPEVPLRWIEVDEGADAVYEQVEFLQRKHLRIDECAFDACMFGISDAHYLFYLNMHHLITDATSSTLLWQALWTLYTEYLEKGTFPILELLPFEASLQPFESAPEAARGTAFRKEAFHGIPPQTFYGCKARGGRESTQLRIPLGTGRLQKMKALLKLSEYSSFSEDMGFYHILLSVYAAFLSRITESSTVHLGIPVHHRSGLRARRSPGLWIEFFPFELDVAGISSFKQLYQEVKSKSYEFLKRAVPGSSSAEANRHNHAVFNYIPVRFKHPRDWSVVSQWMHPGESDPSHLIRCHFSKLNASEEPELWFDLNSEVFTESIQRRVPKHFLALLDAFLTDQDLIFQAIPLEDRIPVANPVFKFDSLAERARCFVDHGNKIALVEGNAKYTFGQLDGAMDSVAVQLRNMGVQAGDHVGLYFRRSSLYVAAVWTCLREGIVFVPLDPAQPVERLDFMVKDAGLSAVLTASESIGNREWENGKTPILGLDNSIFGEGVKRRVESTGPGDVLEPAYILYTSGSSGYPKGVLVSQGAIARYINWAANRYAPEADPLCMPLFTSIGFDLTLTSLLAPLFNGGQVIVIPEDKAGPDLAVLRLGDYPHINAVKLTPSHLRIWLSQQKFPPSLEVCILGGEDLQSSLAQALFSRGVQRIYNEYGPTEATVGCIVAQYDKAAHLSGPVPIGHSVPYANYMLLDNHLNPVPEGMMGELYLYGPNLATGYWNRPELNAEQFVFHPSYPGIRLYKTGDYAQMNEAGELIFRGRRDAQIKHLGYRIELSEIENTIKSLNGIEEAVVIFDPGDSKVLESKGSSPVAGEARFCANCGLPSTYPKADFDEAGVCHLCRAFEGYESKVEKYFKTESDLEQLLKSKKGRSPHYDCLTLLSGGKDSTYVLARLVGMGLRVLAFTLDNGYISDQAKANIDTIVEKLGVDHVYGSTPHMNTIFVDSLNRHDNVCNGCFKTIYTLSTKLALEKDIPFVVTGLSRGQFFETRLSEELFWHEDTSPDSIDGIILEARKLYHQEEDAVSSCLDVSMFRDSKTFEQVQYIDFYRYSQVSLEELLQFLRIEIGWERPTDTGRSTNCLINQAGIYVHKKNKGYSNYAFPYSWDVRLGHKRREESLEEINEEIDELQVHKMLDEIGYSWQNEGNESSRLLAFYIPDKQIPTDELRAKLAELLPPYMLPAELVPLNELPMTDRGKVARNELLERFKERSAGELAHTRQPVNDIQEMLQGIWEKVLSVESPGIEHSFIQLGGHSLAAIRVTAQVNELLETDLPLSWVFEYPTIEAYAEALESYMRSVLQNENPS
jgi:amino acid adenylation domain-containing protein